MRDLKFPFLEHVGAELVDFREGYAKMEIVVKDYHLQHLNFVHGGVISTLLDNTGGCAAMTMLDEGWTVVTMQINIDYLKPAKSKVITAEANVIKKGKIKSFVEVKLFDDDNNLIAHATGNYANLDLGKC